MNTILDLADDRRGVLHPLEPLRRVGPQAQGGQHHQHRGLLLLRAGIHVHVVHPEIHDFQVRQEDEAASFRVHLQPKSSRGGIVGETGGVLKLRVTAPPVEGRANEACLRLLAKALDLPISRLRIVSGQHARLKRIRVAMGSAKAIRAKLLDLRERPRR